MQYWEWMRRGNKNTWTRRNGRHLAQVLLTSLRAPFDASALKDIALTQSWGLWGDRSKNPLTARPRSFWSQSDEDGIIDEIVRRLELPPHPTFVEFGVDDGTECNSVALLAQGWRGCWIGGQELAVNTEGSDTLLYIRDWITADNVAGHVKTAMEFLSTSGVNLCSMDLDGNDYHLVKILLEGGFTPDVWVCEYNGTIPLGARWVMPYDKNHAWRRGSDYFGASFTSFSELMASHGYTAVATSVTGANMFLVKNEHLPRFDDVPLGDENVFRPALPFLVTKKPFRRTPETIEVLIR